MTIYNTIVIALSSCSRTASKFIFMEVPDAPAPSEAATTPSTIVSAASDESLRAVVDNDVSKKGKRINYQFWEISVIVYGCHAACVAKPQSTV